MSSASTQLQFNRRSILANITALFSGSAAAQGMTALALLLTARQLGSSSYGQYISCFIATSLSSIVFSLGQDVWLLREGGKSPHRLAVLFGSVFSFKFFLGLIWLLIIFLIAPLLNQEVFPTFLTILSAFTVWLDSLFASILTAYKSSLKTKSSSLLETGSDLVWLATTIGLIYSGGNNPATYMGVRLLVLFISVVFGGSLLWRELRNRDSFPDSRADWVAQAHTIFRECPPYAVSEFLAWLSMRQDVLIVSLILGNEAVGLYSPAIGIVSALFLLPMAVYVVLVPVLSSLFAKNMEQAWITAVRTILLELLIGLGLAIMLFFGAGLLAGFLGPTFAGSQDIMRIFSPLLLFKSLSFAMAAILLSANQQKNRAYVQAVTVFLNAALNLIVINYLGIKGVAWVYVFTELVLMIGYTVLTYRTYLNPSRLEQNRTDQSVVIVKEDII